MVGRNPCHRGFRCRGDQPLAQGTRRKRPALRPLPRMRSFSEGHFRRNNKMPILRKLLYFLTRAIIGHTALRRPAADTAVRAAQFSVMVLFLFICCTRKQFPRRQWSGMRHHRHPNLQHTAGPDGRRMHRAPSATDNRNRSGRPDFPSRHPSC